MKYKLIIESVEKNKITLWYDESQTRFFRKIEGVIEVYTPEFTQYIIKIDPRYGMREILSEIITKLGFDLNINNPDVMYDETAIRLLNGKITGNTNTYHFYSDITYSTIKPNIKGDE